MKNLHLIFTAAYIDCALWSSTDDHDEPLDENYRPEDIAKETVDKMLADCAAFMAESSIPDNLLTDAGRDFWLTRNGHGSGFWDKPEIYGEERAKELSTLAETFGVVDLYVGDDGRIYG